MKLLKDRKITTATDAIELETFQFPKKHVNFSSTFN